MHYGYYGYQYVVECVGTVQCSQLDGTDQQTCEELTGDVQQPGYMHPDEGATLVGTTTTHPNITYNHGEPLTEWSIVYGLYNSINTYITLGGVNPLNV